MTERSQLAARVADLARVRLLCVGDVMLDRFVYGKVERISPEAPVPILTVDNEMAMLGGAGNVVRNLAALGASCCFVSLIGSDAAGREVLELIAKEKTVEPHMLLEPGRRTTIKMRYVAGSQQLLRADRETVKAPSAAIEADLIHRAEADLEFAQVLLLSDYGKGVLTPTVTRTLIDAARRRGRAVVVDPRGRDHRLYAGATVLTPNRRELGELTGLRIGTHEQIVGAARKVIAESGIEAVLVTLSQDGMLLIAARDEHALRAEAREVFDVSGAGDTVAAMLGAGLAAGLSLVEAAKLANVAAGIVVGKVGTAVAYPAELIAALHAEDLKSGEAKALTVAGALDRIASWRRAGLKIGFTNGCFDLLHPGHVSLLAQARAACDRLVVGLNGDESVARLKGPGRPVQSEAARAAVLGSLATVDLVVIFGEDTPARIIDAVRPDVLVKGADYTVDTVVGADFVQSYGGRVLLADLVEGHSTSGMVRRMGIRA
jgi:D-beta-D-heptose 7-phosphate kinase/D-beta-D-heptose 1-phosphate adenosyltransferase